MTKRSDKSYAIAVCLSAIFGVLGVQHFYLGRYLEGFADLAMTIGGIYWFFMDHPLIGFLFIAGDFLHAAITTIMLLTGCFKDGKGRLVCYPGQVLK